MILAALALALQAAPEPPPLLRDPAFLAAHQAWAACTNRAADAQVESARSAEEIAAAAAAACADEQAAARRAVVAFSGEARGAEEMAVLLDGDRQGLVERVRELRRRAAARAAAAPDQAFHSATLALAQCQKDHVDAALPGGGAEREITDSALGACPDEEAALRAAMVRMLGDERSAEHLMAEARRIGRESMQRYIRARRRR